MCNECRKLLVQAQERARYNYDLRRALERALRWVPHGEERQKMLELVYRDGVRYPAGEEG